MDNFLNALNEKIIITNFSGEILFCNYILLKKLKFNLSDILNLHISNLVFEKEFSIKELCINPCKESIINLLSKDDELIKFNITTTIDNYKGNSSLFIIFREVSKKTYSIEYLEDALNISPVYSWYKSYEQLNTMKNILNENNDTIDSYRLLDETKKNILRTLNCSEFHIWVHHDNHFIPYRSSINNIKSIELIKCPKQKFDESVLNFSDWGIKDIHSFNPVLSEIFSDTKLKYIGIYPIIFNDEIIGLFYTGYKNHNPQLSNEIQFIPTLCKQLGVSIKNFMLSQDLKQELEKRIDIENELSFLLDTAVDMTSIITLDGTFKKVNYGWSKHLGWDINEVYSKNWTEIIHPDDLDNTINYLEKKLKNQSVVKEISNRQLTKNGDYKWFIWNCEYLDNKNLFYLTARDITDEKNLEKQNKIIEEALQIENIKNEFFANISHEFKTPLNIILACIQVISFNIENGNINVNEAFNLNKYINSIKQNSYRLLRLSNNIIDITKIDTGYYEIHPKNCNIVSIIEDITISVAQYIEDKGIELIFDTDVEEKVISCDPEKIERIMLNLLSNAVKYSNLNGKIEVNLKTTKDKIIISVKDNGIGISKENLSTIFNRFMRVDDTLTRKCEGSGLGLSLVESLVKMHNGEISIFSKQNIGTEITFNLPIITLDDSNILYDLDDTSHNKVEKCNIEFSDIYNIK